MTNARIYDKSVDSQSQPRISVTSHGILQLVIDEKLDEFDFIINEGGRILRDENGVAK